MTHFLRPFVHENTAISEVELHELETLDDFHQYFDNERYEFHGNFIITDDEEVYEDAVWHMCCGIVTQKYMLASGKEIFFAFDYGH